MPHHVVDKVADALNSQRKSVRGSRVLVLGIAYKRDIDDVRESPALDIMAVLEQKGAIVEYHDPFVPHLNSRDWPAAKEMDALIARVRAPQQTVSCRDEPRRSTTRTSSKTRPSWKRSGSAYVFKLGAPAQ
jgi:UDP-N-acetyl-D-mannosaminuronate dehydrogenase